MMQKKRIWMIVLVLLALVTILLTLTSCDTRDAGRKAGETVKKAVVDFCEGFCSGAALIPGSAAFAMVMQRKNKRSDDAPE